MMPSCDQTGVPGWVGLTHFHSSTTSGSAALISVRILLRVSPRQSPSSAILFEMSADVDWPSLAPDFFVFFMDSSREGAPLARSGHHDPGYQSVHAVQHSACEQHKADIQPEGARLLIAVH